MVFYFYILPESTLIAFHDELIVFCWNANSSVSHTNVDVCCSLSSVDNSGVIIVVIIVSILLLAILGSVFYFLYKKAKLPCGRSGKQEMYVIRFPSI